MTPRAAPFCFVGSAAGGDGLADELEAVGLPGRRRLRLRGAGLSRGFRSAARPRRARRSGGRSTAGRGFRPGEKARDPAPDDGPDRRQQPLRRRAGTVPVRAPVDAAQPRPLAAGRSARGRPRLRAAARDRRPRGHGRRQRRPAPGDEVGHGNHARRLLALSARGLFGHDWFGLVLVAAVVVGTTRNFSEGALFRAMGDTTRGRGLLRAHAVRTTVNQAAVFGSPFFGLLLFRFGGGTAVLVGVCLLLVAALALLGLVPELERGTESTAVMFQNVAVGMASLRANQPSEEDRLGQSQLERLRRRCDRPDARHPA